MKTLLIVFVGLLGLTGCVSTDAVLLGGSGTYPEIAPERVRVFLYAEDVPVDYEQIALVTAEGPVNLTGEAQMIRAMRKQAAKLGADALILEEIRDPSWAAVVAGEIFGFEPDRKGTAVAIRLHPNEREDVAELSETGRVD